MGVNPTLRPRLETNPGRNLDCITRDRQLQLQVRHPATSPFGENIIWVPARAIDRSLPASGLFAKRDYRHNLPDALASFTMDAWNHHFLLGGLFSLPYAQISGVGLFARWVGFAREWVY